MKHIYFTVTNDLSYDQRMQRICGTLAQNGFAVTLVGRQLKASISLQPMPFQQKRLRCFFNTGFLFYVEYNLRLFFYLLSKKMDAVCAIDLDTILPCLAISKLKKVPRVYDAHEYFTELKEVRTRPVVKRLWTAIERFAVPKFKWGYTVSAGLSEAFAIAYKRDYKVIRNLPVLRPWPVSGKREKFILYQGAVNQGRGFEILIPAMKQISYRLIVCGDGNFMAQLKGLIRTNNVEEKVELKGMLLPDELRVMAQKASLGIGLAEREGINQYHALPNKFLDYMHAGLPQVAMKFPEYERIHQQFKIAVLLDDLTIDKVAQTINATMENEGQLKAMEQAAIAARNVYNWQAEESILRQFYKQLFSE